MYEHIQHRPVEGYVDVSCVEQIAHTMAVRRGLIVDEKNHSADLIYRSPVAKYVLVGNVYHVRKTYQCGTCADFLSSKQQLELHLYTQHERTLEENDNDLDGRIAIVRVNSEDEYQENGSNHYFVDRHIKHKYVTGDFQHRRNPIKKISEMGFPEIESNDLSAVEARQSLRKFVLFLYKVYILVGIYKFKSWTRNPC